MAEDLIKVKDLPIINDYTNIYPEDRVVTTHLANGERQTVAITIDALGRKVLYDAPNSIAVPYNFIRLTEPTSDVGKDGDLYFKIDGELVTETYVKVNGRWISFQVTDNNWRKFLEGQGFDVISYDATSVKAHAFDGNMDVGTVIMPNVTDIYEYAFHGSSIKTMSFPICKFIDKNVFQNCESYVNGSHIDLPVIEEIGNNAFDGFGNNSHIATINISNVTSIGSKAFYTPYFWNDSVSGNLDLPNCTTIGNEAFSSPGSGYPHLKLRKINLPSIVTIGDQAFRSLEGSNIEIHIGPNCTTIGKNILWDRRSYQGTTDIYIYAVTPPSLDTALDKELGVNN